MTSHDVVSRIRRQFSTKRVGHAGTLDPLASGLLVVAIGPATRFLQYLKMEPKVYRAEVTFGAETATYDAEGEITARSEPPADLRQALTEKIPPFLGLIEQVPPIYSAVKIAGRPMYDYARKGQAVEAAPRRVFLKRIDIESVSGPKAKLEIECSGGTYIRSLAHDLGAALGCGAYLSGLVRTSAGRFSLTDATPLAELNQASLLSLADALQPSGTVTISEDDAKIVQTGKKLACPQEFAEGEKVVVLTAPQSLIGIARYGEGHLYPECILPIEAAKAL